MSTKRELVIKAVAMPSDLNPHGDMFGGWIMSQMDLAAYLHARKLTRAPHLHRCGRQACLPQTRL
ncbi:MAG: hotdog domain-containing protein [Rickettsiales bacterium]